MSYQNEFQLTRYFKLISAICDETPNQDFSKREDVLKQLTTMRDTALGILATLDLNSPYATALDVSQLAWFGSMDVEEAANLFMYCEGQVSGIDFYVREKAAELDAKIMAAGVH